MKASDRKLVQKEMNKIINRCLFKPSGDPDNPLLRRAAAAYIVLVEHDMMIDDVDEVMEILKGANCENTDYLQ